MFSKGEKWYDKLFNVKCLPLFHNFKAIYQFPKHIILLVKIVANASLMTCLDGQRFFETGVSIKVKAIWPCEKRICRHILQSFFLYIFIDFAYLLWTYISIVIHEPFGNIPVILGTHYHTESKLIIILWTLVFLTTQALTQKQSKS